MPQIGACVCTLFELSDECVPLHDGCLHRLLLGGRGALQLLQTFLGGTENQF